MSATVRIDKARRLIVSKASGTLTDEDIYSGRTQLLEHPDFDREFGYLFDLRDVEVVDLSAAVMGGLAGSSIFSRDARRAFVVTTAYQHRLAWVFVTLARAYQPQVHVFRDVAEAEAWLLGGAPTPEG
jgi:hypothetical protein